MKKIYLDMTKNDCTSVFMKDTEVIPAGTSIYSMPVKERNSEYEELAEKYDVHFIFDDCKVVAEFYTVPYISIWATDSAGGFLGTIGEMCDMESAAPICYIDKSRKVFLAAENFKTFYENVTNWKQCLMPYEGIVFYASRKEAEQELEFVEVPVWIED